MATHSKTCMGAVMAAISGNRRSCTPTQFLPSCKRNRKSDCWREYGRESAPPTLFRKTYTVFFAQSTTCTGHCDADCVDGTWYTDQPPSSEHTPPLRSSQTGRLRIFVIYDQEDETPKLVVVLGFCTVRHHVLLQLRSEMHIRVEILETVQHDGRVQHFLRIRILSRLPIPRLQRREPSLLYDVEILQRKPANGLGRYLS